MTSTIAFGRLGLAFLLALTLASPAAQAGHGHHGHGDGGREEREERESEDRDVAPDGPARPSSRATEDDDSAEEDGGAPLVVSRTPAQLERRDQLVAKERELVGASARRNGKKISPRERQEIGLHWRHVMRLSRIRELAEEDHDTTLVARVDALIERADKKFSAKMDGLAPSTAEGGTR